MRRDAELTPVEAKGDTIPAIGTDMAEGDPVVMFTEWMAPYLSQGDVPSTDGVLDQFGDAHAWGDQPVRIDAHETEARLDIGAAHGRTELGAILCEAIQVIRDIADSMGLSHYCE